MKKNILILSTGSIAVVKLVKIIQGIKDEFNVQVVLTESASKLVDANDLDCKVYKDQDEWKDFKAIGDDILHIELRKWADLIVIAPLSANSLAKISNGLCDNLLTSILRAKDDETKVIAFPSMNTYMYKNPLTAIQLDILRNILGFYLFGPIEKTLACGDSGIGAMSEYQDIINLIYEFSMH
ncbi:flavo protein [Wallemia mellicola]|uniref:Flavo protein n=1 Tax=Wallemia mellicola TaxID=1708541 RepID=A0A4T0R1I0_9BASI|nr:hypothetical protein E3Q24_00559 [Wallemia mellicola]TIB79047.1 hypothetical protein E3Q23_00501 [Wallemia mellicola]TIB81754.1 flavo protein [Wallemia mellicola]TIB89976.1 flavo protein [Wallemia mellicola]TIB92441.1 flavo protein [Wallemia mellicola]